MNRRTAIATLTIAATLGLAVPADATVTPRLTSLSSSTRNISYKTTTGVLKAIAPGASVSGARSVYASCSGTTVYAIDGGPVVTQAKCTWRTLTDGHSYVYKAA